jgi:hypothetical protein
MTRLIKYIIHHDDLDDDPPFCQACLPRCLRATSLPAQTRGKKRQKLLAHSSANSVRAGFDHIVSFPKDSLLVIAQSHGIQLGNSPACETLSAVIVNHVGTGGCTSREGYSSYLAFSSI